MNARELCGLSERYAELEIRVYEVEAEETVLGGLFVAPETHTLVWDGALSFEELEYAVLEDLPWRVWEDYPPSQEDLLVAVALFLRSGEMVEGVLGRELGYEEHAELIANVEQVTAVRHDVAQDSDEELRDAFDYAFTAENPLFARNGRVEMTVQLPAGRDWTAGVVEWVVEHHHAKEALAETIDAKIAAEYISWVCQEMPA